MQGIDDQPGNPDYHHQGARFAEGVPVRFEPQQAAQRLHAQNEGKEDQENGGGHLPDRAVGQKVPGVAAVMAQDAGHDHVHRDHPQNGQAQVENRPLGRVL